MKNQLVNGVRLREAREQRHWTQEQLVETSGVSVRTIQRAERGEAIRIDHLCWIAEALKVPVNDLIARAPEKPEKDQELVFLPRLTSGDQLASLVGAHARCQMNDRPANDKEREALASFLDGIDDWNMIWSDLSAGDKLLRHDVLKEMLGTIHEVGFWAFGELRQKTVGSAGQDPMRWDVAYLVIARQDNPSVIRKEGNEEVAGLFAIFPLKVNCSL